MVGRICGTGSSIPSKIVENDDLAKIVDTNDEWIRERTGIARRHIADTETTSSLAADAAKKALENAGMSAEEIDLILVATISSDKVFPCTACEVQKNIGAVNATCFDLGGAACSGFVFAYNTAQMYIAGGMYKNILVIGAENLSNLVDWTDRGTCILFGDGAGAAVVSAVSDGMFFASTHSDGEKGVAMECESRCQKNRKEKSQGNDTCMKMDGRAVFQFAVRKVPEVIKETLEKAGLDLQDVDYFVLHQANRRIVESVAKRLKIDVEKFPTNIEQYGNTSAASIPILLDEMNRDGRLKKGQTIVMAGFGAGLSWGATVIKW